MEGRARAECVECVTDCGRLTVSTHSVVSTNYHTINIMQEYIYEYMYVLSNEYHSKFIRVLMY